MVTEESVWGDSCRDAGVRVWGMRSRIAVEVTAADRDRLHAIVANRHSPQKHVWRAAIVLATPLSLPIVCVGMEALIFAWPETPGIAPRPQEYLVLTERLTEFVVIIALMGAGLKLDRPLAFATSGLTWRLLAVAMPLTILPSRFWATPCWGLVRRLPCCSEHRLTRYWRVSPCPSPA